MVKRLIKYCDWELKNEFMCCGYFCAMLFCYVVTECIYGKMEISIWTLLQMFLLNYVISTVHQLTFNQEAEYSNKEYYKRAIVLVTVSSAAIILAAHVFSWFKGRSLYAELFMYLCMLSAYLFVWWINKMRRKYDTKELNEQLQRFKEGGSLDGKSD